MSPETFPAAKVAVALFIASEATFFVLLILAYVFLHGAGAGPKAPGALDAVRTGVFSVFLFASSVTFWLGERRLRRGGRRAFAAFVASTIVLGGVFLAGQAAEWRRLLGAGIAPRSDPFATSFFTLTGFHGLHVLVGLVLLAVAAGLGARLEGGARWRTLVESAGWYWHFVDAVWAVIFAVVYLGTAP